MTEPDSRTHFWVSCEQCGCRGTVYVAGHGAAREEAIAAWNTRARIDRTTGGYAEHVAPYAAALRMVREAIGELFGPAANLESEEAELLRGPEPHHTAEALIAALQSVSNVIASQDERIASLERELDEARWQVKILRAEIGGANADAALSDWRGLKARADALSVQVGHAADYLDNLQNELIAADADMMLGNLQSPSSIAEGLRAALTDPAEKPDV